MQDKYQDPRHRCPKGHFPVTLPPYRPVSDCGDLCGESSCVSPGGNGGAGDSGSGGEGGGVGMGGERVGGLVALSIVFLLGGTGMSKAYLKVSFLLSGGGEEGVGSISPICP